MRTRAAGSATPSTTIEPSSSAGPSDEYPAAISAAPAGTAAPAGAPSPPPPRRGLPAPPPLPRPRPPPRPGPLRPPPPAAAFSAGVEDAPPSWDCHGHSSPPRIHTDPRASVHRRPYPFGRVTTVFLVQDKLVWIDCEMTGLRLESDKLIEIAALVTDSELNMLGEGVDIVIHADDDALAAMPDVVKKMHAKSGLTEEVRKSTVTLAEAEKEVLAYIREHVPVAGTAPLAGNSIATDRGFISRDMSALDTYLHYRMIDVSSIKELSRRLVPANLLRPARKRPRAPRPGRHQGIHPRTQVLPQYRICPRSRTVQRGDRSRRRGPRACLTCRLASWPTFRLVSSTSKQPGQTGRRGNGGRSSVGRAPGCDPGCRGFESRRSPKGSPRKCRKIFPGVLLVCAPAPPLPQPGVGGAPTATITRWLCCCLLPRIGHAPSYAQSSTRARAERTYLPSPQIDQEVLSLTKGWEMQNAPNRTVGGILTFSTSGTHSDVRVTGLPHVPRDVPVPQAVGAREACHRRCSSR